MKTSLSVIAFVTACGPLTRDVFAWNNKPAFFTKNISPLQLLTTNKSNYSYLLLKEIQKIRSGKGILKLIGGKFDLDKADTKNSPSSLMWNTGCESSEK